MHIEHLWWRDGVIYQIYPRSFLDTTGSGIGDLHGISEKVPYLADLGVDAIWLSPIFPSPDVDFGYDVANYRDIDPKFGSLADLERLVETARKHQIEVIMDLVLNHTSDQHPWFRKARSSRENPYRDYYLWQDARKDGKAPNNWRAMIGGRAWEWDENTRQYYYHMFYKEQPDVNWRNPKVRSEMLDVFKFWLDKGIKGFRLDIFNVYFKDAQFRDNPVKLLGRRPFEWQKHLYDYDQPEMIGLLQEIRQVLDQYEATYAVGETFLGTPETAATYCGEDKLHGSFNFELANSRRDARLLLKKVSDWDNSLGPNNWPTYFINNHDVNRSASRFGKGEDDERMKVIAAMLLSLRGTPFLYYGEEIGMRDIRLKRKEILDPVGKHYWPLYKGRDRCRAPMQWDGRENAGFSSGSPWLPVHPDHRQRNVQEQAGDASSLLHFYKQMIAFRRATPALTRGEFTPIHDGNRKVMAYARSHESGTIRAYLNFSGKPQLVMLDAGREFKLALSSKGRRMAETFSEQVLLKGDEALFLRE